MPISPISETRPTTRRAWVHKAPTYISAIARLRRAGRSTNCCSSTVSTNRQFKTRSGRDHWRQRAWLTSNASGTRLIDNNRFDKYVTIYPSTGATVTNNRFDANVGITGYTARRGQITSSTSTEAAALRQSRRPAIMCMIRSQTTTASDKYKPVVELRYHRFRLRLPAGAVGDFVIGGPSAAPERTHARSNDACRSPIRRDFRRANSSRRFRRTSHTRLSTTPSPQPRSRPRMPKAASRCTARLTRAWRGCMPR